MSVSAQNKYREVYDVKSKYTIYNPGHIGDYHCICGQSIKNLYFVKKKKSKTVYIIGSKCIKQLFPDNIKLIESVTTTYCECCDKRYTDIITHNESKKHKDLFKYGKTHRKCAECKEYKIKLSTNIKYKFCYNCNIKDENCNKCGEPITHRQFKKYGSCYECP